MKGGVSLEEGSEAIRNINTISTGPPLGLHTMRLRHVTSPKYFSRIPDPNTNLWTQIICGVGNHNHYRAQYRGNHSHLLQNGVEIRDRHHAGSLVIKTRSAHVLAIV